MRWRNSRMSGNVQDRRGMGPGMIGGGVGALVLALVGMFLGVDLTGLAPSDGGAPPQQQGQAPKADGSDVEGEFAARILGETEDTWNARFQQAGSDYAEPQLVLYTRGTQTGCGFGQSAMGPFYCPPDQSVYLDLSFFQDMERQLGAPGEFARAYVIAHEVAHHVQNLTGASAQVTRLQRNARDQEEANRYSVMLELQADCYAGIWAHDAERRHRQTSSEPYLQPGDIESGLNAASAIGDDRLQEQAQGRVVPEAFTHGSSEQRVRWFRRGYETGSVEQCDTFNARSL